MKLSTVKRSVPKIVYLGILTILLFPRVCYCDNGDLTVHYTNSGYAYHNAGCGHLRSDNTCSLYEAVVIKKKTPCEDCNPPIYDGEIPDDNNSKPEHNQHNYNGSGSHSTNQNGSESYSKNQNSVTRTPKPSPSQIQSNEKKPDDFSYGSNQKVWWICSYGHE